MRAKRCETCGNPFTPERRDAQYCRAYCRLKAFRHRHGIRQVQADKSLRWCLAMVSSGSRSSASLKAKLALYLLDGIRVDKDVRKIIESM